MKMLNVFTNNTICRLLESYFKSAVCKNYLKYISCQLFQSLDVITFEKNIHEAASTVQQSTSKTVIIFHHIKNIKKKNLVQKKFKRKHLNVYCLTFNIGLSMTAQINLLFKLMYSTRAGMSNSNYLPGRKSNKICYRGRKSDEKFLSRLATFRKI